jgi:hypothetical protein
MESLGTLLGTAAAVAFFAAVATWLWGYIISGRYRKARQRLQLLIAEVLRDAGHTTFLFVLSRNARSVEVRIPAAPLELEQFRQVLGTRLNRELPGTRLIVAPLKESFDHLHGAVSVWGRVYGDVYVARGGVENAA